MRRREESVLLSLIATVLEALQAERGGNHAPSFTYASFDLVAFGTCPYQPTRILLHTQSHTNARVK